MKIYFKLHLVYNEYTLMNIADKFLSFRFIYVSSVIRVYTRFTYILKFLLLYMSPLYIYRY